MDHVLEFVVIGVSLLLLSAFIIAAVNLTGIGSAIAKTFSNMLNERNAAIEESQYTQYCDEEVSGSDVVSAVRKFRDSVVVKVTIWTSPSSQKEISTASELGDSFQNIPTSENYINPGAKFLCTLERSQNGGIKGMVFKQIAYVSVAGTIQGPIQAGGLTGSVQLKGSASSEGSSEGSSESSTPAEDSGDLDIVFSDEEGSERYTESRDATEQTEESQSLENLSLAVVSYGSDLDNLVEQLGVMDTNCKLEEVRSIKSKLNALATKAQGLKKELGQYKLSKTQYKKYQDALEKIEAQVSKALQTVDRLEELAKHGQDTENEWNVGYPVRTDVKATLKNGVLVFTGSGETDTGHDLPKWLKKAKEIKKVVFRSGVAPVNIDYWFTGCKNLESVEGIPNSVESINGTFSGCKSLRGVVKFGGLVTAANGSFSECSGVKVKATGKSVKTIQEYLKLARLRITVEEV